MKKKLLLALNIALLPVMFIVYLLDRLIVLPLVWIEAKSLQDWVGDDKKMAYSTIRLLAVLIIIGIISLITLLIW
jgi:hypothetical protein